MGRRDVAQLYPLANTTQSIERSARDHIPFYRLEPPDNQNQTHEPGAVAFGWTRNALIARFEMVDAAIVTSASHDNQPHYDLGDTAELFIKPARKDYYWEFYATPNGYRTAMCWESGPSSYQGETLPYIDPQFIDVRVNRSDAPAEHGQGPDIDQRPGWWAEIAVSRQLIESRGDPFDFNAGHWTVLASRYNYPAGLPDRPDAGKAASCLALTPGQPELTSFPRLPEANFHLIDRFAELREIPYAAPY
ncbi:MAG: hypothetical protein AAF750_15795 [Planctomycetota bacterium]